MSRKHSLSNEAAEKLLDDIFETPEENIDLFVGVLKDKEMLVDPEDDGVTRMTEGRPDQVAPPLLKDQIAGGVRIQHGWHGDDYVWHIGPNDARRSWKVSNDRVAYAIAKCMNEDIPESIEVKIWLPYLDWEIKEITFKAINLKDEWSISDSIIEQMTLRLFGVLNALI